MTTASASLAALSLIGASAVLVAVPAELTDRGGLPRHSDEPGTLGGASSQQVSALYRGIDRGDSCPPTAGLEIIRTLRG